MAANITHNADKICQTEQPSCTGSTTVSNHCNHLDFSSFISFSHYITLFSSHVFLTLIVLINQSENRYNNNGENKVIWNDSSTISFCC